MHEIFSLPHPLKTKAFEIQPFALKTGTIYKVTGPFGLQNDLLGKAYKKRFSLHGKAKVIFSTRAEAFQWKNVRALLEKRRGPAAADLFMQSFHLPDDATVKNLSGISCLDLFNFELNYDKYDLFYFIHLGYDPTGNDLFYKMLKLRIHPNKCFIVQYVWETGKESDTITFSKL